MTTASETDDRGATEDLEERMATLDILADLPRGTFEVASELVSRWMGRAGDGGREIGPRFPDGARTCGDYERISECIEAALAVVDAIYLAAMDAFDSGARLPGDSAAAFAACADAIASELEWFWASRASELDLEREAAGDDADAYVGAPPTTVSQKLSCAICLARVTSFAITERPEQGKIPVLELRADSFPSVREQMLAQSRRPVMSYTAKELLDAFDALALAWKDVRYDGGVSAYVSLLSLRYGSFLRCARTAAEYGDVRLHRPPNGAGMCSPSRLFIGMADARLRAFCVVTWALGQQRTVSRAQFAEMVADSARRNADVAPGKRERPLPPFDPDAAAFEVLLLATRYAEKSACVPIVRDAYSKLVMECAAGPGDARILEEIGSKYSRSAKNVSKLLHGKKYVYDAHWNAFVERPDEILSAAVARERAQRSGGGGGPSAARGASPRSRYSMEEEIAGLCAFDGLFKGRHYASWTADFFVGGNSHRALVRDGTVGPDPDPDDPNARSLEVARSIPRVAMIANTFDVLFGGVRLQTAGFFEALAWWLEIMLTVHGGIIPLFDRSSVAAKRAMDSASLSDVDRIIQSAREQVRFGSAIDVGSSVLTELTSSPGSASPPISDARRRGRQAASTISCDARELCSVVRLGSNSYALDTGVRKTEVSNAVVAGAMREVIID